MRNRSRYKSTLMAKATSTNLATGVVTQLGSFASNVVTESMEDQPTIGFHNPRRRGLLPQNPLNYSCQSSVCEVSKIKIPLTLPTNGTIVSGPLAFWMNQLSVFGTPDLPAAPSYNIATLTANAKARAIARFDRPNFSFGEPLAELRYVVQTIRDPLRTVARILKRFHKDRIKRVDKFLWGVKDTANLHLGYVYGIAPLIRTADDVVNAYVQRNRATPIYQKCYASEQAIFGPNIRDSSSLPFSGWVSRRKGERTTKVKVKAGFVYSSTDSASTGSLLGLRARDWPGVAWELVPLSFLVDRVINVKRFLNSATSLLSSNVRVYGGYVTTRIETKIRYRHTNICAGTNPNRLWEPSDTPWAEVKTFSFTRSKWSPGIGDVVPKFDNRLFDTISSTLEVTSIVLGRLKIPK